MGDAQCVPDRLQYVLLAQQFVVKYRQIILSKPHWRKLFLFWRITDADYKDLFTPSESQSKRKKSKINKKNDQRISGIHQGKYSLLLLLGMNRPLERCIANKRWLEFLLVIYKHFIVKTLKGSNRL